MKFKPRIPQDLGGHRLRHLGVEKQDFDFEGRPLRDMPEKDYGLRMLYEDTDLELFEMAETETPAGDVLARYTDGSGGTDVSQVKVNSYEAVAWDAGVRDAGVVKGYKIQNVSGSSQVIWVQDGVLCSLGSVELKSSDLQKMAEQVSKTPATE